jgi:hypothetical protein
VTTLAPNFAITLFALNSDRTVADYRAFSEEVIRPGMVTMPAVIGFLDYEVAGSLEGDGGIQLVELIEITSPEEFIRDNDGPLGAPIAAEWSKWVSTFRVLFVRDLEFSAISRARSSVES